MSAAPDHASPPDRIEAMLRADLARCEAVLTSVTPIVRHLVGHNDSSLFSDEIVARTRAMLADLARQLLLALASAAGQVPVAEPDELAVDDLVESLAADSDLVSHVHALALEWQLVERCQQRLGLDPILSPLLQALISSPDPETAASAMGLLAAQGRFVQSQRRMQLPLSELPADHLHAVLQVLVDRSGNSSSGREARQAVTADYDEGRSRLGLMARLVFAMGGGAHAALALDHAGVSLFLTALAISTGQDRALVTLTTNETLMARLVLTLAAAGLKPQAIEEQFAALHPDISLGAGVAAIGGGLAADLLSRNPGFPGRA